MSSEPSTFTDQEKRVLIKDGYNAVATQYMSFADKFNSKSSAIGNHIDKLISVLPSGAKVLELGCGPGKYGTKTLVDAGLDVTATDVSTSQIELCKEYLPISATLIVSDMMTLDFPSGSFDAVVAFHSIPHLTLKEQPQMIAKMIGWLKDGGWLLFNLNIENKEFADWMGVKMYSWSPGEQGNKDMMDDLVKTHAGLRIVEAQLVDETVGRFTEQIHWFMAQKLNDKSV